MSNTSPNSPNATSITIATASKIRHVVEDMAMDPTSTVTNRDIGKITGKITNEIAPMLINASNNEPIYQSRVFWGTLIASIGTIVKPFTGELFDAAQAAAYADSLATIGQLVGLGIVIYGRFFAQNKKPLGS